MDNDVEKLQEAIIHEIQTLRHENKQLRHILTWFAEKEECDTGFLIDEDNDDHTCTECKWVLLARRTLGRVH